MFLTLIEWIVKDGKNKGEEMKMYAYVETPSVKIELSEGISGNLRKKSNSSDDVFDPLWLPEFPTTDEELYKLYVKEGMEVIKVNVNNPKEFIYCGANYNAPSTSDTSLTSTQPTV